MLMKRSLYNSLVPLNTKLSLLYNSATDKFLVFKSGLLNCEWSYENLSPSLYETLKAGGFIVDDSKDEWVECDESATWIYTYKAIEDRR